MEGLAIFNFIKEEKICILLSKASHSLLKFQLYVKQSCDFVKWSWQTACTQDTKPQWGGEGAIHTSIYLCMNSFLGDLVQLHHGLTEKSFSGGHWGEIVQYMLSEECFLNAFFQKINQ